jgi:hypothetical protein
MKAPPPSRPRVDVVEQTPLAVGNCAPTYRAFVRRGRSHFTSNQWPSPKQYRIQGMINQAVLLSCNWLLLIVIASY